MATLLIPGVGVVDDNSAGGALLIPGVGVVDFGPPPSTIIGPLLQGRVIEPGRIFGGTVLQ